MYWGSGDDIALPRSPGSRVRLGSRRHAPRPHARSPQASRSPSQRRRLRLPGRPRRRCASTSSGSRPARRRSPTCSTPTAQPGAAVHGRRQLGGDRLQRARRCQPRSLEQALRRRPAARPERAHNARHVPHRGRGAAAATSPPFRVAGAAELFRARVADIVSFFQAQRDGGDVVPGPLHRKPAHLNDRALSWYAWPRYENADSDVIVGSALTPLGGRRWISRAGGWTPATSSSSRTRPPTPTRCCSRPSARWARRPRATLDPEARFGLRWLRKAWDPAHRRARPPGRASARATRPARSTAITTSGACPQRDDALTGAANRYLTRRPAFRANDPGTPLPPNLAGRVSAAFALAAQIDAAAQPAARPARARRSPRGIFAAARDAQRAAQRTWPPRCPTRSIPRAPGATIWSSAAAELALAGQKLGDPRAASWLKAGEQVGPRLPRQGGGRGHAQPLRHERARPRRSRARAAQRRTRHAPLQSPAARRPARAARARPEARTGRPLRGRGDLRRLRRRAAHLRAGRHGAALPRRSRTTRLRRLRDLSARLGAGCERLGRVAHDRRRAGLPALPAARRREPLGPPGRQGASAPRRRRQRAERRGPVRRRAGRLLRERPCLPAGPRAMRWPPSPATAAASSTTSAHGRRSSPQSISTPPRRSHSRSPRRPRRERVRSAQAAWSSEPCRRTRRRRMAFVCSWETRDSVTLRTSPISRRVSSS